MVTPHGVVHKIIGGKATDTWSRNKKAQKTCSICGLKVPKSKFDEENQVCFSCLGVGR